MTGDWTGADGNRRRSGNVQLDDQPSYSFTKEWEYNVNVFVRSPLIWDNKIYLYNANGELTVLDEDTGNQIWYSDRGADGSGGDARAIPEIYQGTIFICSEQDTIIAFDATDGTLLWENPNLPVGDVRGLTATADSTVDNLIIGSNSGDPDVVAINMDTGAKEWETTIRSTESTNVFEPAANYQDYAYVTTNGGSGLLAALDVSTGEVVWEYELNDYSRVSPMVQDGTVFAVDDPFDSGWLHAVDATSGAEVWSKNLPGGTRSRSFSVTSGSVFVPVEGSPNKLVEYSTIDGQKEWETEIEYLETPTVTDDFLYIRSGDQLRVLTKDTKYQVDRIDGLAWRYEYYAFPVTNGKIFSGGGAYDEPIEVYSGIEVIYHKLTSLAFLPGESTEPNQLDTALPEIDIYSYEEGGEAAFFDAWHHSDEYVDPKPTLSEATRNDKTLDGYSGQTFHTYRFKNQIGLIIFSNGENIDYSKSQILFNGYRGKYNDSERDPSDFEFTEFSKPSSSTLELNEQVVNPYRDRIESGWTTSDGEVVFNGDLQKQGTLMDRYYDFAQDTINKNGTEIDAFRVATILGSAPTYTLEMSEMSFWDTFDLLGPARTEIVGNAVTFALSTFLPVPAIYSWIEYIVAADGTRLGIIVDESVFPEHTTYEDEDLMRSTNLPWQPREEFNSRFTQFGLNKWPLEFENPYTGLPFIYVNWRYNLYPGKSSFVGVAPDGSKMTEEQVKDLLSNSGIDLPLNPFNNTLQYSRS